MHWDIPMMPNLKSLVYAEATTQPKLLIFPVSQFETRTRSLTENKHSKCSRWKQITTRHSGSALASWKGCSAPSPDPEISPPTGLYAFGVKRLLNILGKPVFIIFLHPLVVQHKASGLCQCSSSQSQRLCSDLYQLRIWLDIFPAKGSREGGWN